MSLTVGHLAYHPLKSGAPVAVERATLDPWGLRGDRRWMLVDDDGFVTARHDHALLQVRVDERGDTVRFTGPTGDGVDVAVPRVGEHVVTPVWGDPARGVVADDGGWFSALLGRPVRLLWCDDPTFRPVDARYAGPADTVAFADGFPLLLTTTASLVALQGWVDESCAQRDEPSPELTMARFRPNVVVEGAQAWAEQEWSRIAIGDVTFRAPKLCGRCVMPNVDLDTLAVGKEPLRTLAARNRIGSTSVFGTNLIPDGPGVLRVGDEVRVIA